MSRTSKKGFKWLKNPLFYMPLIGVAIFLVFFMPHSNYIVRDNDSIVSLPSDESALRVICRISDGLLVEDSVGNRFFAAKERVVDSDSMKLLRFNSECEYYVKMESVETLFQGMTINEVVDEIGDYVYGNIDAGTYTFPYIIAVEGKIRHHGVTVCIGSEGRVDSVVLSEKKSTNWFGALPFYPEIVSLNMYTPASKSILVEAKEPEKDNGFIVSLLLGLWNLVKLVLYIILFFIYISLVLAVPLCIIFPILRLFTFIKAIPNWGINLVICSVGAVIVYIIMIAQVEGTRQLWLITLPVTLYVGFWLVGYYTIAVGNDRCPQCRKDKALTNIREPLSEHTSTKEEDHSIDTYREYISKEGNYKIYHQHMDCWRTQQEIVTTEYLVTDECTYCSYTKSYNVSDEHKGECVEIDRWTDFRVVRKRIPETPAYTTIDTETIADGDGRYYTRVSDGVNTGSRDYITFEGNRYIRRG